MDKTGGLESEDLAFSSWAKKGWEVCYCLWISIFLAVRYKSDAIQCMKRFCELLHTIQMSIIINKTPRESRVKNLFWPLFRSHFYETSTCIHWNLFLILLLICLMSISLSVHPQELKSGGCRNFYLPDNGMLSCMVHTEKENLQEEFGQWDLKAGEFRAKVSLSPLYAEPQRKPMVRNWEILQNAWTELGTLLSHLPSAPRRSPQYCVLEGMVLQHSIRCAAFQALPTLPTKVLISDVTVLTV